MKKVLLHSKSFSEMNEDEFYAHAKSLYIKPESKSSKNVEDIMITFGKKAVTVRFKRANKTLTEAELALLSVEYKKPKEELLELLTKRKIKVINEQGVVLNEKRDDIDKPTRRRKKKDSNKLLESGSDQHLQT